MWGALSDERMGPPFTITAGPRQRSHSWVRVPQDSWPYFTISDSRLPQPGGSGLRIHIPEEQGCPVIPLGTGFPFRRRLQYDSNPLKVILHVPPRVHLVEQFSFLAMETSYVVAVTQVSLAVD
jgi:hypothetical protein